MSQPPAPAKRGFFSSAIVRGTSYSLLGQVISQLLRLVSNVILTRLLFPEAFGLMAVVYTWQAGLEMLSDIGVQPSIIQHARGDEPAFLNTAWSVQALRGTFLFLAGMAIAYPVAQFYEEPQLFSLIAVASAGAFTNGLISTKLASLYRHIQLGRVLVINVASQVASIILMVSLAYTFHTIWALVLGALLSSVVTLLLSHLFIPGPNNRPAWDREALQSLLHFGKWIFVSTMLTFAAQKFDVLVLAKLIPMKRLGIYSIGNMLANLPIVVGGQVVGTVLMPALAKSYRESHQALVQSYRSAKRVILLAHAFVTLGLVMGAPTFFLLYDARYHDAGWIVQLLMCSIWFQYLEQAGGRALLAIADAQSLALTNLTKLITTALCAFLGFHFFELPGFMIGLAIGSAAGMLVVSVRLERHGIPSLAQDLVATGLTLLVGLIGAISPIVLAQVTDVPLVVWSVIFAVVILVPLGAWSMRRVLAEVRAARQ
ncbi:MAG: oligosaccharide flippase family protein [Deltaproteobacteria bacterium]|nr:oligosaccharide flippase family protein [Deltaproteobacteria bacterium]